jgi:hypothetical protein
VSYGVEGIGDGVVGAHGFAFGAEIAEALLAECFAQVSGGFATKVGDD